MAAQNKQHLPIKRWSTRNHSRTGAKHRGCALMLSWPGCLWRDDGAVRSPTWQIKETIVVLEQKYNSALSSSPPSLFQIPDRGNIKHSSNTVYTENTDICYWIGTECVCVCVFCHSLACHSVYFLSVINTASPFQRLHTCSIWAETTNDHQFAP